MAKRNGTSRGDLIDASDFGDLDESNIYSGLAGDDTIRGGYLRDQIDGGRDNDRLYGDDGSDRITDNSGDDAFYGEEGDDRLTASGGSDTLDGGAGDDTIQFGAGAATVVGGQGDDIFITGGGAFRAVLNGGAGADTVDYSLATSAITVNLGSGLTAGAASGDSLTRVENLIGTRNADRIFGSGGANYIEGGAGADTIGGIDAGDRLLAGKGVDVLSLDGLQFPTSVDLAAGTGAVGSFAFTFSGFENVVGSDADDKVLGNAAVNVFEGLGGNDSFEGGANDDLLKGGAARDTLSGGTGADTLVGGLDSDLYFVDNVLDVVRERVGDEGSDGGGDAIVTSVSLVLSRELSIERITLAQASGDTGPSLSLTGNEFSQFLGGNRGDNTLDGGGGNDTLSGGRGDDLYYVDDSSDVTQERNGEGTDTVITESTFYRIGANIENLTLASAVGASLVGNKNSNVIIGNSGDDRLTGYGGDDTITGGAGQDNFIFESPRRVDVGVSLITDFSVEQDTILIKRNFLGFDPEGRDFLHIGTQAESESDQIIYDDQTGMLYVDADGAGGDEQTLFAQIAPNLALTIDDFFAIV